MGWPCGCAKLRKHYIFAHIRTNMCIYAEYADLRIDMHQKKVAHGQPILYTLTNQDKDDNNDNNDDDGSLRVGSNYESAQTKPTCGHLRHF